MLNKKRHIAEKMVNSLETKAEELNVSLEGINKRNWKSFIDNKFNGTGEIRYIDFIDFAWEYGIRFEKFGYNNFKDATFACIQTALEILEEKYSNNSLVKAPKEDVKEVFSNTYNGSDSKLLKTLVNGTKIKLIKKDGKVKHKAEGDFSVNDITSLLNDLNAYKDYLTKLEPTKRKDEYNE